VSTKVKPWYTCENGLLTVYSLTNTTFPAGTVTPPTDLTTALKMRMVPTLIGLAKVTILGHNPP